jgi:hypothetical protein
MTPETLDFPIVRSLQAKGCQTLPEITAHIRADGREVLKRLHVLSGLQRISSGKVAGLVKYWPIGTQTQAGAGEQAPRVVPVSVGTPAAPAPAAAPRVQAVAAAASPPSASALTITDQIRAVLRAASSPMSAAEVIAMLPGFRADSVGAILPQRVTAGEFSAVPPEKGRGRRYAIASTPPMLAEPLTSAPVVVPAPVAKPAPRKRNQAIVVRPRTRILELCVQPLNDGDAIITCDSDEEGKEPDQVFIPRADIPALIEALQQVIA